MKLEKDFILREVAGQYMLLPSDERILTCSRAFCLSEPAAWLWKSLQDREFSRQDAIDLILNEYETDDATASADVDAIIEQWRQNKMLYD